MPPKPKPVIRWEPTAMLKHPDSIISSDYSNYKPQPLKYLKERVDIGQLLSMEYARNWFEEKLAYEKSLKPACDIEYLRRRYAIRGLNIKKLHVDAKCHLQEKTIKNAICNLKKC